MEQTELMKQLEDMTEHEVAELFCMAKQNKEARQKNEARTKEQFIQDTKMHKAR